MKKTVKEMPVGPSRSIPDILTYRHRKQKSERKVFWVSLIFLLVISIGIAALGIWSWRGIIEESVPGSGQIIPSKFFRKVMSPMEGLVTKVHVHENQKVKAGQPLVELDPQINEVEQTGINDQIKLLQEEMNAIQDAYLNRGIVGKYGQVQSDWLLATQQTFQSQMTQAKMQIMKTAYQYRESLEKLNEAKRILATGENLLTQYNELFKEGGLPERDLRLYEQDVMQKRGELAALQQEVQAKEIELDQAEQQPSTVIGNYRKELLDRLSEYRRTFAQLQSESKRTQVTGKHLIIRAPIDGTINEQIVRGPGEAVTGGQALMSVVPEDSKLIAEIKVKNQDLTYINLNQRVALRFEALPYYHFGRLFGFVDSISPSTVQDKEGKPYYVIWVRPEKTALKDKYGDVHYIQPGMTVNADFITRKQNIIDFIIEPVWTQVDRAFRDPTTR